MAATRTLQLAKGFPGIGPEVEVGPADVCVVEVGACEVVGTVVDVGA